MMTIDVFASANQILPGVIDLRRKIHANPELGNQLPETTAAVLNELSDLGLEIRASKETTSLIATLKGEGDGPRILLRGDMDALPVPEDNDLSFASRNTNKMHACGHDAHTAMLVGAARLLQENKAHVHGTVRMSDCGKHHYIAVMNSSIS